MKIEILKIEVLKHTIFSEYASPISNARVSLSLPDYTVIHKIFICSDYKHQNTYLIKLCVNA